MVDDQQSDYSSALIKRWINKNKSIFKDKLRKGLLEPFKYKVALSGVQADNFFGALDAEYELRASKLEEIPMLVATPRDARYFSH